MARLDEDQAAFTAERLMHAQVWTAHPGSGGVAAVLIFKDAIDHIDLLTTVVPMRIEESSWCSANHRRVLHAEFCQWQDGESGDQSWKSGSLTHIHNHATGIQRIQVPEFDQQDAAVTKKRRVR